MKYLKYIILSLVIVIIIVIIILLIIMNNNRYLRPDEIEYEIVAEINKNVTTVKDRNNYYIVKDIVESYYYDLSQFNMKEEDVLVFEPEEEDENILSESIQTEIKAYKNKVYNCLDEEYIKKNNVTIDNIQEKLGNYDNIITLIEKVYFIDLEETIQVYFVTGEVIEKDSLKKEEFSLMITIDTQNSVFEIYPKGYEYNVDPGKEININKKEVKDKIYNRYTYKLISEEEYCIDMFKNYKDKIVYSLENAYNNLNEEYRKAKFSNETEFKNYINNNYYRLINANLSNYQITKEEEKIRYVFNDTNNNSYIFKENAPMEYEVILDTYTIDLPEFTQKYDVATDKEKVILNINKFILSINDKDYKYAYSLLADSFKANNFKTQAEFEKYAKANFFEKNEISFEKFGDEAGTYYTYLVYIKDSSGETNKQRDKTFIMLLENDRKFQLSFNV